jgi:hypothetical protein
MVAAMNRHTIIATAAATLLAGGTAAATSAAAADVTSVDGDADRVGARQLRLSAETRGADSVRFLYAGRSYAGRLVETDDGERDWTRTVTARKRDRRVGRIVTFKVRACDGGACTTRTIRDRLERED